MQKNSKRLHSISNFSLEAWNQRSFFSGTFPYIEISEIDLISGNINNIAEVPIENAPSRAKVVVRQNDILISTTRPNRGAICYIENGREIQIASTGFANIREVDNRLHRKYLFYALKCSFSLKQMERKATGGNYPAITFSELGSILIPIPSSEIQAIVIDKYETALKIKAKKEQEAFDILNSINTFLLENLDIKLPKIPSNDIKNRIFYSSRKAISGTRFDSYYNNPFFKRFFIELSKGKYPLMSLRNFHL